MAAIFRGRSVLAPGTSPGRPSPHPGSRFCGCASSPRKARLSYHSSPKGLCWPLTPATTPSPLLSSLTPQAHPSWFSARSCCISGSLGILPLPFPQMLNAIIHHGSLIQDLLCFETSQIWYFCLVLIPKLPAHFHFQTVFA